MKGDVYGESCMAPYRNKAARLQLHLALLCAPANRVGASWVVLSSSGARKMFPSTGHTIGLWGRRQFRQSWSINPPHLAAGPIDRGTMPARASH